MYNSVMILNFSTKNEVYGEIYIDFDFDYTVGHGEDGGQLESIEIMDILDKEGLPVEILPEDMGRLEKELAEKLWDDIEYHLPCSYIEEDR